MYDYETIKHNFEGNTKMLSHKEMCAKMGEKYNSNPAQIERQRERWKQIISWKYNKSKKVYYAIKVFPEEEIVFNLIESNSKDKLSYARQFYNDSVLMYNNTREKFPSNIIANIFGFKEIDFFKTTEKEKEVPNVKF